MASRSPRIVVTRNPCTAADVTQFLARQARPRFNIAIWQGKEDDRQTQLDTKQRHHSNRDGQVWKTSAGQPGWMSGSTTFLDTCRGRRCHRRRGRGLFDMAPAPRRKNSATQRREERKKELRKSIVERLAKEPKPVVKITYENEQALIDIGGKKHLPLIYNASGYWAPDNPGFIKQVENFRKAGFHLYGLEPRLTKYWKPDGSIDFSAIDNFLESAVMMTQEGYIMFDIVAHEPPRWWLDKYPEELIDYANGGINPKAYDTIDRVIGTSYASEI